ncbi:hypothetical protein [Rhodococcus sp. NPDC058514]|uniref:hypothetical protein n=1 Tax=unclassified Rhodococcus (in: high G+C Gram-positive bacteria) TaxID=192944 RepID=UPI003649319A
MLDGPLTGLAPWIVLAVVEGPGRVAWAAGIALAISVVFIALDLLRGRSLKLLGVVDVVFFAALLAVHFLLDQAGQDWMETWVGEIANITLVVIAVGSMLARVPFTIQYAREEVDEQYWRTPTFLRINYVITGVWAAAFLVAAIAGFYGDAVLRDSDNLWTGWVIQTAAILCALQFSAWYPEDPRPPLTALFAPLAVWLIPLGILIVTMGDGPDWLGYTVIAVGVGTQALLRRESHG